MRDDFTPKTINTLSRRTGFLCSNPDCRRLTVGSHDNDDKSTLLGVAAHITAASTGGPRYNSDLSSVERSSIKNAIWLCVNCSTLIDKDPNKFSTELLNKWKKDVEEESATALRSHQKTKTSSFKSSNSSAHNLEYDEREKTLMTSFLQDIFEDENTTRNNYFFMNKYQCQEEEVEYILKAIYKENSKGLDLFTAQVFDDDSYVIVELNKYVCKKFLDNGGFSKDTTKPEDKKESFEEKAERVKTARKKQLELDAFLKSPQAIEEARNQVKIIISKLKEKRQILQDPATGFHLGTMSFREDMYSFGYKEKFICFDWRQPYEENISQAVLVASLLEVTGMWEFDREERAVKQTKYKYTRNLEDQDGWVNIKTGKDFMTTDDLLNKWLDAFLEYIDYN
jgi:hypothetical protein